MVVDPSEEEFEPQLVTYTLQIAGRFVVVENVPARVSLRTGERFFSPETVEQLQQAVWDGEFHMRRVGGDRQNFLPRSLVGRAVLLILSVIAIPFSGVFLFLLMVGTGDGTWGIWLLRIASGEFFAALFATGWVGLLWAVATPHWLPTLAERVGRRMSLCLLIPWVLMLGFALWPW